MGDHRQYWPYSGHAHRQHHQHQRRQHQQNQQYQHSSQNGSEEEDFFSLTESTTDQGAHSPNVNNADYNDGYYSISPGSSQFSHGRQGQRQFQANPSGHEELSLRSHHIRPPDNNELPEFSQDIDALLEQAQLNHSNNGHASLQWQQGSREASRNYQFQGTVPQLNPQVNPQADPGAPSWNPVTRRTPPQRPRETFVQQQFVDVRNIDPRLLQAQVRHVQPSSTATTQADYAPPVTPSNDDRVSGSIRSDPQGWACQTCSTILGDPRTLRRHRREVHGESAKNPYVCPCGRRTKRLWNHTRHMESCRRREEAVDFYLCWCGCLDIDYEGHRDHIKDCGKQTAGRRPRGQDASSSQQLWYQ